MADLYEQPHHILIYLGDWIFKEWECDPLRISHEVSYHAKVSYHITHCVNGIFLEPRAAGVLKRRALSAVVPSIPCFGAVPLAIIKHEKQTRIAL